ncbi:MAG: amidase family protein, partial [Polyangiaceae bacterium]
EGAAIASGMSPLGVGSDIGGSIRVPAAFCGICGIKPTLDRFPMKGCRTMLSGQEAVRAMGGPLARTVSDLALFFGAFDPRRMAALDPLVPPVPWGDPAVIAMKGLRVGVYADDGVVRASSAVARGVERAAAALRGRGAEIIAFEPPDVTGMLSAYLGALSADNGRALGKALEGGEVDRVLRPLRQIARVPVALRRAAGRAARARGQPGFGLMLSSMGGKTVGEFWALTARLRAHRAALIDAMDRDRIDVLLTSAYATPALPHGLSQNFTVASSGSMMFNAVHFPAGVVPVARVRPDETKRAAGRDLLEKRAATVDAQSAGLPVGVQVAARPWSDHVVLAVMKAIEEEVSGDEEFPRTPVEPR